MINNVDEIQIIPSEVMRKCLASGLGLDKYKLIIEKVKNVNVSSNLEFQTTFNDFYGIRRNPEWREKYYGLFEEMKLRHCTYKNIIEEMYNLTGNIEASFSSKMYASLNSEKPVWDKYVLEFWGLHMPQYGDKEKRLQIAIDLYSKMEQLYSDYLHTENAQECLKMFDHLLPEYTWISDIKKLDFYIWSIR